MSDGQKAKPYWQVVLAGVAQICAGLGLAYFDLLDYDTAALLIVPGLLTIGFTGQIADVLAKRAAQRAAEKGAERRGDSAAVRKEIEADKNGATKE